MEENDRKGLSGFPLWKDVNSRASENSEHKRMRLKHLVRHQARENHKTSKQTNKKLLHVDTLFSPKFVWWDGRIHGRWWYYLRLLLPPGIYRSWRISLGPGCSQKYHLGVFLHWHLLLLPFSPPWRILSSNQNTVLIMHNLQREHNL